MKKLLVFLIIGTSIFQFSCDKNKDKEETSKDCSVDATNALFCNTINKDNTVNGFVKNYYPGSSQVESEGNYTNGIPNGFWKFYYSNGNLKYEGNYTNQKQTGFCKEYFENGFIKEEGNFENCVRNGFYKFYHSSKQNQVESEGNYTNGIKTGTWKYYDADGKNTKTINFKC